MTPRRRLTFKASAALWHKQGECCAECREPLVLFHADHMNPLWCTGTNDADNWQLLCIPCHAAKTKREAKARAKTKRLEAIRLHGRKAAANKLPLRPFDTSLRRRLNGRVEVRR